MQFSSSCSHSTPPLGCVEFSSLYQHPLLEHPPTASAPAELRRRHLMISRKVENLCRACPALTDCLFNAVVKYDVAGFVAATTVRQRRAIRARLGVIVDDDDFDTIAGICRGHRQIDHEEVIRLRAANPHESLDSLANRLGCSLSTVKRHLRKHREGVLAGTDSPSAQPPTKEAVLSAYLDAVAPERAVRAA